MLILAYIAFIGLVILHTFEEIACGIMSERIGKITMTPRRYLMAASGITTVNAVTLALIVSGAPVGDCLGLATAAVFGVFQAVVHAVGYFREGKKARGLGAGFFSSIPLAIGGAVVCILILNKMLTL